MKKIENAIVLLQIWKVRLKKSVVAKARVRCEVHSHVCGFARLGETWMDESATWYRSRHVVEFFIHEQVMLLPIFTILYYTKNYI